MTKLILLGIDGATWSIIAPLVLRGKIDNFKRLMSKSTVGILESTVPAESPPAWTSMFTGVNPGKHGIVDFYLFEHGKFVPCFSQYCMTKSIWRIMSEAGKKCVVLNNPVSYPPEAINGLMTSGLMTPPGSSNWIYPLDRKKEIDIIANGYECDISPDFADIVQNDKNAALEMLKQINRKILRVSRYAIAALNWDVLAVILTATDRLQHFWWNDEKQISDFYRGIDSFVGELADAVDTVRGQLMVVSDHGFGPCKILVDLNESLEHLGLALRFDSPVSRVLNRARITRQLAKYQVGYFPSWFNRLPVQLQNIALRHVPAKPNESKSIDTKRSVAFAKTAAGVFLNSANFRDNVVNKLKSLVSQESQEHVLEKITPREEVLVGPFVNRAPHLFLQPRLGYGLGVSRGYTAYMGTHRPEGIFIHYKSKSNQGEANDLAIKVRPWDIASCILHTMGVHVPSYFDGDAKKPLSTSHSM